jgi:hypothetical protein
MCVGLCVRRRFRVLIDWRNRPGQSDSETGNRPGQSDSKNENRSGLRTGGQTGRGRVGPGRAGGQGAGQGGPGGRGQGTAGRAGAPTGDFTVAFGHGHPLVFSKAKNQPLVQRARKKLNPKPTLGKSNQKQY